MSKAIRNFAKGAYVTSKGLEDSKFELEFLKTTKRIEIAERIQRARELGDLAQNSEYDAAIDQQALVENQIAVLENTLKDARVITNTPKSDSVVIGSTVVVDLDGEVNEFVIVGRMEADPSKKKISNESPVGSALLGSKIGESVEIATPNIHYRCKVLEIK